MKPTSNSSIIICSIVRDAEQGLKKNIPVIKELCRHFKDYHIVVYENDSRDATKQLLTDWMESDREHVAALMNNTDPTKTIPSSKITKEANPFFCRKRIEKMAALRNQYMQYIEQAGWEADYLMVVDLDVANISLQGILTSFDKKAPQWDAVTAYGYSTAPNLKRRYHDTYALVEKGQANIPQTEQTIHDNALAFASKMKEEKWIQVDSAFGGLAIYRFEAIKGLRYQVLENNDSRVEVRCEHQSIYRQMSERGATAIYVNPLMKLKYQNLTIKIVWGTIKRKFTNLIHV